MQDRKISVGDEVICATHSDKGRAIVSYVDKLNKRAYIIWPHTGMMGYRHHSFVKVWEILNVKHLGL